MGRKKGRPGSNQMILINSNVTKFFKKQHTDTFYYFANKGSLDESDMVKRELRVTS